MALRFSTENEFDRDIRRMLARAEMDLDEETEREDLRERARLARPEDRAAAAAARIVRPDGFVIRRGSRDFRAEQTGGKKVLKGHAAVFNKFSEDLGGFKERLAAGCFSRSLRERPDVAMLNAHDVSQVLARSSNDSLDCWEDDDGLCFEAELSNTNLANDVFENIRNGLVTSMSFGMVVKNDSWQDGCDDDGSRCAIRTVTDCDLLEISCVLWAAYPQTDVSAAARALPATMPAELRSRYGGGGANIISEAEQEFLLKLKLKAALLTLDL